MNFRRRNRESGPQPTFVIPVLRHVGGHLLADFQDKTGARLYFNTLIPFEKGLIKYGVISTDALLSDLLDWESLYAGGRLHKPVNVLEKAENVVSS